MRKLSPKKNHVFLEVNVSKKNKRYLFLKIMLSFLLKNILVIINKF